jgi:hypothetical protein
MKRKMDGFMDKNKNLNKPELEELQKSFLRTLEVVISVFGENAFHRWMPERRVWRQHVLAALYDAQMFSLQHFQSKDLVEDRDRIIVKFKELFDDSTFRQSIDAATNTPTYFKDRIRRMQRLIEDVISERL